MTNDLVKRLRAPHNWFSESDEGHRGPNNAPEEAADRIEELEAENARLDAEAQAQAQEVDLTRRRADKWQSMVLDCEEHLKDDETPAQRIKREIQDNLTVLKLLEKEKRKSEALGAENARLRNPPEEYCAKCGAPKSNHPYRHPFQPRAALEEKNDE